MPRHCQLHAELWSLPESHNWLGMKLLLELQLLCQVWPLIFLGYSSVRGLRLLCICGLQIQNVWSVIHSNSKINGTLRLQSNVSCFASIVLVMVMKSLNPWWLATVLHSEIRTYPQSIWWFLHSLDPLTQSCEFKHQGFFPLSSTWPAVSSIVQHCAVSFFSILS